MRSGFGKVPIKTKLILSINRSIIWHEIVLFFASLGARTILADVCESFGRNRDSWSAIAPCAIDWSSSERLAIIHIWIDNETAFASLEPVNNNAPASHCPTNIFGIPCVRRKQELARGNARDRLAGSPLSDMSICQASLVAASFLVRVNSGRVVIRRVKRFGNRDVWKERLKSSNRFKLDSGNTLSFK